MDFVRLIVKLYRRLLDYRDIIRDENRDNRMSCTVNLLVSQSRSLLPWQCVQISFLSNLLIERKRETNPFEYDSDEHSRFKEATTLLLRFAVGTAV